MKVVTTVGFAIIGAFIVMAGYPSPSIATTTGGALLGAGVGAFLGIWSAVE